MEVNQMQGLGVGTKSLVQFQISFDIEAVLIRM